MSQENINCYLLPNSPLDLLLPIECVAEIVAEPQIEELSHAPANWMRGHINWQGQRLPVLSYAALHDSKFVPDEKAKPLLVVLNPIPNAARKAFSALLCYGDAKKISIDAAVADAGAIEGMDKRYIQTSVQLGDEVAIVPRLEALGVAFSYF